MVKFLIDANLPYRFSIWSGKNYVHVFDLNDEWTDDQIWEYATINHLTIVTKDSDFSDKILLETPPPKVIHLKIGNMKMTQFHQFIVSNWDEICRVSDKFKMIKVFRDRIEGVD